MDAEQDGRLPLGGRDPAEFVAIIGMAGRFPGAADLDAFWQDQRTGTARIRRFTPAELLAAGHDPARIADPAFVPARGYLDDADAFDAAFFGISPRDAAIMDPQHRIFLECCHAALLDAGRVPGRIDEAVGVYAGCSANAYLLRNLAHDRGLIEALDGGPVTLASDKDYLATRAAWKLDLRGPAVTVLSACSTGLLAVHQAVQALLSWQCDLALAGASSVTPPLVGGHTFRQGSIYSPDGRCLPYDARAQGTVNGDGVGVVLLKRLDEALADGDPVHAVILGSAVNNDGGQRIGFTAPGVTGQAEVVTTALGLADVPVETIGLFEGHGTATALGDPVEIEAATRAWRAHTDAVGFCALGSVKANIGHLNAAAGVAGLVRAVLALRHDELPPSPWFESPNPQIDLARSPFYVPTEAAPFPDTGAPRRAAISSFGAGGTNVHLVLEQGPPPPAPTIAAGPVVLAVSGRTAAAAERAAAALADHLDRHRPSLADVAWTLQHGRDAGIHRRAVVADAAPDGLDTAVAALRGGPAAGRADGSTVIDAGAPGKRPVAFVFPGQGFQHPRMGHGLYQGQPVYRAAVDRCLRAFSPWLPDLRETLFPPRDAGGASFKGARKRIAHQRYAGAAMFTTGWALAELWRAHGVEPAAVLGHSTGEYVAACVAGMFALEEGVALFMARAEAGLLSPEGAMVHLPLPSDRVVDALPEGAWLALENSPRSTVVAGTLAAMDEVLARFSDAGARRIQVSAPGHSPLLQPVADAFAPATERHRADPARLPILSAVTGDWLPRDRAVPPAHWLDHLLSPVRFRTALETLAADGPYALVELGPPRSVQAMAALTVPGLPLWACLPGADDPDDAAHAERVFLRARAGLWTSGAGPLPDAPEGRRISLPTYPFERQRHWIDPPGVAAARGGDPAAASSGASSGAPSGASSGAARLPRPALPTPYVPPRDRAEEALAAIVARLFGIDRVGVDDSFLDLGGSSVVTLQLLADVEAALGQEIPPAAAFSAPTVAGVARHLDAASIDGAALARARGEPPPGDAAADASPDPASSATASSATASSAAASSAAASSATASSSGPPPPPSRRPTTSDVIVPLRATGTRTPLFIVHPAAGVVFPYFELVKALGPDQPVYAIQASGLDGRSGIDRTVAEMADRYVPAILQTRAEGPYRVIGYSFGCCVAWEIGRRLHEAGHEVDFCGLLDELAPTPQDRARPVHFAKLVGGPTLATFFRELQDWAYLISNNPEGRVAPRSLRGGLRRVASRAALAGIVPKDSPLMSLGEANLTPMAQLFLLHSWEYTRYAPPPADLHVHVIRSDFWKDGRFLRSGEEPRDLGWSRLARRGVTVLDVPGDHLSMLRDPQVRVLAARLEQALAALGRP
ncbi:MAG: acyltransferase domain-containing protein [Alphaproteobacteria bacterium]|nr:acyltransferase domain-containing protein [Alphaproteobacteria bacterium]